MGNPIVKKVWNDKVQALVGVTFAQNEDKRPAIDCISKPTSPVIAAGFLEELRKTSPSSCVAGPSPPRGEHWEMLIFRPPSRHARLI